MSVLVTTEAQTSPPTTRFYRPELDVLRFIAFFVVFLHHATMGIPRLRVFSQSCRMGMCLFFVLSAYLITELLLKERHQTGTIHLRAFYIRRILRIWPLYFFSLALAIVIGFYRPAQRVAPAEAAAYLLFVGNWYSIFFGPMKSAWALIWSITVEEQFYLVWPFLSRLGTQRIVWGSLLTFPIAALTLALLAAQGHVPLDIEVWTNSFFQFAYFGTGALLAIWLQGRIHRLSPAHRSLAAAFAVLLFALSGFLLSRDSSHYLAARSIFGYSLVDAACVLLFLSLLGLAPALLPRSFIRLGKISYGLYLFHGPVLFYFGGWLLRALPGHRLRLRLPFTWLASLLLTIALAELSYRFLEKPFLQLKSRFEFIHSRPA